MCARARAAGVFCGDFILADSGIHLRLLHAHIAHQKDRYILAIVVAPLALHQLVFVVLLVCQPRQLLYVLSEHLLGIVRRSYMLHPPS